MTIHQHNHLLSNFRQLAAGDPPIETVVAHALELAQKSLGVSHCAYAIHSVETGSFLLRAGIGWRPGVVGRARLRDAPGSLAARTVLAGRPIIVEDLRSAWTLARETALLDHQIRSTLTAPVFGQQGALALLGAFSSTGRLFTAGEADFLWGLARVISAAWYRAEWRGHMPVRRSSPSTAVAPGPD